jgi:hypothetical protein
MVKSTKRIITLETKAATAVAAFQLRLLGLTTALPD